MPAAHHLSNPIADALRLLPRAPYGRAAVTRRALPHVLVAQHLVVPDQASGDQVLLRVPAGQIEPQLLDGTVLAYHAQLGTGWTEEAPGVQLIGTATTVSPAPSERAAFLRSGRANADPPNTLYARLVPRLATIRPVAPT